MIECVNAYVLKFCAVRPMLFRRGMRKHALETACENLLNRQ